MKNTFGTSIWLNEKEHMRTKEKHKLYFFTAAQIANSICKILARQLGTLFLGNMGSNKEIIQCAEQQSERLAIQNIC